MEEKIVIVMPNAIKPIGSIPVVSGQGKISVDYEENKEEQKNG